jgi:hypothetical protein
MPGNTKTKTSGNENRRERKDRARSKNKTTQKRDAKAGCKNGMQKWDAKMG